MTSTSTTGETVSARIHFEKGLHVATVRHLASRLSEAETSLNVFTGGAVDAIVDSAGQAYLLSAAQERFRRDESRIRSLLDSIPDVIIAISHSGKILSHSAAAGRLLGYDCKELIGRNIFELVRSEDVRHLYHTLFGVVEKLSATAAADFHLLARDGSWRRFEAMLALLLDPPESPGLILVLRDAKGRQEDLEDALRQKIAAETERFLTRLAVELQRPLALALLGLDTLDDAPPAEAKPILEMIRCNLGRQSQLLEELLDLANKNPRGEPGPRTMGTREQRT